MWDASLESHAEYDEIGKLVEVNSPTFKTVKETYSDKKDAAKDVVKLKSKLLDSSGELADTASTLKGSLDAAKEMIGKVPAMTPTNYAQLYYSSELMDYQADAIALQGDSLEQVSPEQMHIKLVDSTRAALTAGAQSAMIGYKQLKLNEESLESGLTLLEAVYQSTQNQAANGLATQSQVLSCLIVRCKFWYSTEPASLLSRSSTLYRIVKLLSCAACLSVLSGLATEVIAV